MPARYLFANWKMNLPLEGISSYLSAVDAAPRGDVSVVIAPPFPYLLEVASRTTLPTAAQNCSDEQRGAFTGEVSAAMIAQCGARYVILGHSERRSLYGETDEFIARKLVMAFRAGLIPVLCIGEMLSTRDAGQAPSFLAAQIQGSAQHGLPEEGEIVVAYEPVWAIGTGRNASGRMVAETVAQIREALARFWPGRLARAAPVVYGGSVTPENVDELEADGRIDGYLCGGASLESIRFTAILNGMQRST